MTKGYYYKCLVIERRSFLILAIEFVFQIVSNLEEEAITIKNSSSWEEPKENVFTENTFIIAPKTQIIGTFVLELFITAFLFTKFNCGVLVFDEPQVEAEETSDDETEDRSEDISCYDEISH